MGRFRYCALDAAGRVVVGSVEASSHNAALRELEKIKILPIEVSDETASGLSLGGVFSRAPSREEITGLTRDLATLIKGGVTLDRALVILAETATRPALSGLMLALHEGILSGRSLAEALAAHPTAFPRAYVKMVQVAEAAGSLDATLEIVAHERSRGESLRRRIASALTYPSFLVLASTGVLVFVLTAIIPEFERALVGFQTETASSTERVFALSRWLRANGTLLAVLAVLALAGALLAARSHAAKASLMQFLGRVPGVREVVQYERTVVFCATLGALTASAVDISAALRLVADLMRDRRSAAQVDLLVAGVRQGRRLSDALRETGLLPAYAVHMLRVGEESGELDKVAMRTAAFYEGKLDRALTRLTSILGPAVIILVSLLIAWLIVSVITALLSVNELLL